MIELKTPAEIVAMRRAGLLVGETLELLRAAVAPGVTTAHLDALAEENIRSHGGVPSFKGYRPIGMTPFPGTICASVNDEVVHGIPGPRVLREGDVISIDCGAIVEGWHGDAAITVPVGEVGAELAELLRVCEQALWHGLAAVRPGARVSDVGAAVGSFIEEQGPYGNVADYGGHGIGRAMHQDPHVPNYRHSARRSPRLVPGMAIAVEPMVNLGTPDTHTLDDGWTVATDDGRRSAHFEHTVAVTPEGPWVLTAIDGGVARLAAMGVPVAALA